MGKNICKCCDQQELNFQNTQTAHTTQQQQQESKQLNQKNEDTIIDISPKKTYRWLGGTWKDVQHC